MYSTTQNHIQTSSRQRSKCTIRSQLGVIGYKSTGHALIGLKAAPVSLLLLGPQSITASRRKDFNGLQDMYTSLSILVQLRIARAQSTCRPCHSRKDLLRTNIQNERLRTSLGGSTTATRRLLGNSLLNRLNSVSSGGQRPSR